MFTLEKNKFSVMVRFTKSDGEYHRTLIFPTTDVVEQMSAVNVNLAEMGCTTISDADIATLAADCAGMFTPDDMSAYLAAL